MLARSVRYFIEGALAVFYGERVLRVIRANGLVIFSIAATLLIVCVAVYVLAKHIRSPRKSAMEQVAEAEAERKELKAEGELSEP
jgi:uncharacterized membrane protein